TLQASPCTARSPRETRPPAPPQARAPASSFPHRCSLRESRADSFLFVFCTACARTAQRKKTTRMPIGTPAPPLGSSDQSGSEASGSEAGSPVPTEHQPEIAMPSPAQAAAMVSQKSLAASSKGGARKSPKKAPKAQKAVKVPKLPKVQKKMTNGERENATEGGGGRKKNAPKKLNGVSATGKTAGKKLK